MKYLEGAVHEGFVQVDHHAVLAVVCYTDLWQEELGWWLQRQHTSFMKAVQWREHTHTHTLTEGVMMSVWDDPLAAFGDTTETSNSMKDLKEGVTWLLTERYDINTLVM